MPTIDVHDAQGEVRTTRELPAELFEHPVNTALMHQVVVAGAAAQRSGTHSTKTRGEVAGGGKKPWRQKGTGRARQGSIRAPHWMGGGVAHGPHPRSYEMRVNRKMKKAALRSALSDALASGKVAVVDHLAFGEPRTKDAIALLAALGLEGRVLLVIPQPDELVEKCFRNLRFVKVDYAGNLSTYDLLLADRVLFTAGALDALEGREPEPTDAAEVQPDVPAEAEEPDQPDDSSAQDAESAAEDPDGADDPDATDDTPDDDGGES